jgi:thymidylate synthase (FAD)
MNVELMHLTADAGKLVEHAGRTSYQSFQNETAESYKTFIRMLLKNGHESVLEHASVTFKISGVSRALTHQLVRHRMCTFTQQSQRYVDEENFSYVLPDEIRDNDETNALYSKTMQDIRKNYSRLRKLGIKKEDARYILPNATESEIILTANLRELRHVIRLRGEKAAQWEIRRMAIEMLKILKEKAGVFFQDMEIDERQQVINIIPL